MSIIQTVTYKRLFGRMRAHKALRGFERKTHEGPVLVTIDISYNVTERIFTVRGEMEGMQQPFSRSGQILDCLKELLIDPDPILEQLYPLWEKWHLNDLHPECEHQRALGWPDRRIDESKPKETYGIHYEGQKRPCWNILGGVTQEEYHEGLLSKECPEEGCEHRYGASWVKMPIPDFVHYRIAALMLEIKDIDAAKAKELEEEEKAAVLAKEVTE